jgi:hypothetical protein
MSYFASNLIFNFKKLCEKCSVNQLKTGMWKKQSLERTLTLARLAPFIMLSPSCINHMCNMPKDEDIVCKITYLRLWKVHFDLPMFNV